MAIQEKDYGALTPRKIVKELSRFIIGQDDAKKMVAIAIRNRWRRLRVPNDFKKEISPNNIIMIGPTGVGKTEIARRLAELIKAPFVKVEATKYTEVGYVGRNVESMIRDLMESGISLVKMEMMQKVKKKAEQDVSRILLKELYPQVIEDEENETFRKLREMLFEGKFDDREVEVEIEETTTPPMFGVIGAGFESGMDLGDLDLPEPIKNLFPKKKKRKKMKVGDARKLLLEKASEKYIDQTKLREEAKERVEESGIVFIDEFDKIVGSDTTSGPDVSRSGVQRDLLPIVEGTTVATKYGPVKTDHILFIAAGAFTKHSPSDLVPELQGRFPIRVELSPLGEKEFYRILTETETSLLRQYEALFATEGVSLKFTDGAIKKIAHYANLANERMEDLGARRLQTIMAKILEDHLFEVPDIDVKEITINARTVESKLAKFIENEDLSRYII